MWIFNAIANAVGRNFIGSPNYLYGLIFNRAAADGGVTEAQQCTIDQISYIEKTGVLPQASLLVTPTSYKEGKLYADLPINGNGDFTATRATTATRVNADGLVGLVPYNLVQYSEQFENASWGKANTTATANTAISPSGIVDADTYTANGSSSVKQIFATLLLSASTNYTLSVYAKKDTNNFIQFLSSSNAFGGAFYANFDLQNGVIGQYTGTLSAPNISDVGNGWYRCEVSVVSVASPISGAAMSISLITSATSPRAESNTLNTSVFLWGAQLVEGTSARDYLRTETRLNIPRVDYSLGGCPNILLEPQRTNLALQSSSFDNASWIKVSSSVTANTTTSPSGVVDADKLIETATTSSHIIGNASISIISGQIYTFSFFAKKSERTFIQLAPSSTTFGSAFVNYNLGNGTISLTGGTIVSSSIESVGNGWYRCIASITATTTASTGPMNLLLIDSGTAPRFQSYLGDGTSGLFIWGAQLEAGAYSTSYIPTTTASVTRNADSITRNNIFTNGLITAAGGTWFVELRNNRVLTRDNTSLTLALVDTSGFGNNGWFFRNAGAGRLSIGKTVSSTLTAQLYNTTTDTCKIAIKWNGTTADVFENGIKVIAATPFTGTALENLSSNPQIPAFINEMALFPTPISDEKCSMLTSGIYPTAAAAYASLGLVSESPSCLTSTTTF